MSKRILLGGLVGSVIVFVVGAIWHLTPGLRELGVKIILPAATEDTVLSGLRASIQEPGFYIFPGFDPAQNGGTREQQNAREAAYLARFSQGPTGVLVYKPGGEALGFGKRLASQYLFNLAGALLVAWILALTAGATTYGSRFCLVVLLTLFGGIVYELPVWN